MEQKRNLSSTGLERAKMSYPDPKLVEEARKRGLALPDPRVVMGPPLKIDPKTGKVSLAKPHGSEETSPSAPASAPSTNR